MANKQKTKTQPTCHKDIDMGQLLYYLQGGSTAGLKNVSILQVIVTEANANGIKNHHGSFFGYGYLYYELSDAIKEMEAFFNRQESMK